MKTKVHFKLTTVTDLNKTCSTVQNGPKLYITIFTHLKFGQHTLFTVHRCTLAHQQPLGQVLLVESLEHVLAMDEPGQGCQDDR